MQKNKQNQSIETLWIVREFIEIAGIKIDQWMPIIFIISQQYIRK